MPTSALPDATAESIPRDELRGLQLERLRATVARVLAGQPAGAAQLAAGGITSVKDLRSLEDFGEVAFIAKACAVAGTPHAIAARLVVRTSPACMVGAPVDSRVSFALQRRIG